MLWLFSSHQGDSDDRQTPNIWSLQFWFVNQTLSPLRSKTKLFLKQSIETQVFLC